MNDPNIYSTAQPWDLVCEGYVKDVEPFAAQFSEDAVRWAQLKPSDRVLDVACGPGTLTMIAARQAGSVLGIDIAPRMIAALEQRIEQEGAKNIECRVGDGQALGDVDGRYNVAFSMFGLMFFPDRMAAFSELHRALAPGGRVAVSSWAPFDRSPLMGAIFGALHAAKPDMPEPPKRDPGLDDPEVFAHELSAAGFTRVEVQALNHSMTMKTARDFWSDMVASSAPLALLKQETEDGAWREMQHRAIAFLESEYADLPCELDSQAWLGSGHKAPEAGPGE